MDPTTPTDKDLGYLHYFAAPLDHDASLVAAAFERCVFVIYRSTLTGEMIPIRDA